MLVARWIKLHQFFNVLRETEDDNEIIQMLRELQQFYHNMGILCDVGHLRAKGVKSKQVRLRLILKNVKNYQLIKMDVIRR